jgi:hypothetical protein
MHIAAKVCVRCGEKTFSRETTEKIRQLVHGETEPVVVEVPVREAIQEDYLEIIEAQTRRVVTVIEVVSPGNKQPVEDHRNYETKREGLFRTLTNFVEIDLLRDWQPMPVTFLQTNGKQSHCRFKFNSKCHHLNSLTTIGHISTKV